MSYIKCNYLPLLLEVELLLLLTLLDKPFVSLDDDFEFPFKYPLVPVGMGALLVFLLSEDVVVADVAAVVVVVVPA